MNYKLPSGVAAVKGNIVHKALELLGRQKLAIQNNETVFIEPESNRVFNVTAFTTDDAIKHGIAIYINKGEKLTDSDLADCYLWFERAITEYIEYTPLKRQMVSVEEFFDIELPFDWAVLENGEKLRVKGTMDCLFYVDETTIEYLDIKTGRRSNWATGKVKDFDSLSDDFQLLLYYYALRHKYPDKHVIVTILYIKDGGPYTPYFDDLSFDILENKMKTMYLDIRDKKVLGNIKNSFKCNWCPFSSTRFKHKNNPYSKTYCNFFEEETKKKGIEKTTSLYMNGNINDYGDGGGQSNRSK